MRRLLLLSVAALTTHATAAPPPPPEFAAPQSPAKPLPFPVQFIDQGQFDPRLKGYQTPAGFRLEIVATDPVVVNPVGMTFTPDGNLFVLEWKPDPGREWYEFQETFRYRDGTTRRVATMKKFLPDPVKLVKYNATTGTFDRGDVILTDELPSSVLFHDGWLYLTGRGTVRRYRQSKPGGDWDVREVIAQGFCGYHHHQVSGLTMGNDGYLYITSGDDDNVVEGSDGSRATVLRTGAVFRCRPDGSKLETYSVGYRNPYRDLAHDDKFNWFHSDNDNEDGSRFTGCRLVHVAEGVDYGWRLLEGARCCRPDHVRGAVAGELPGKVAPMIKTGRGSPAGVLIYHDTKLPDHYRGLMYYPDVFRKVIRGYKTRPAGSSFEITGEFELLKSDDPLFRPCQMVTGPDGAIYICDWRTDSGGAGKLWGDGKNGRIYRLKWTGTADHPGRPLRDTGSWAAVARLPLDELVNKLAAPDMTDRLVARNELVRRGEASRAVVLSRVISGTLPADGRLPALGVLQSFWNDEVENLFRLLLQDESADVRRLACDGLALFATPKSLPTHDALARRLADHDPAVRRAATLAVARVGADGAADAVFNAWRADDGKDAFLADAYLRSFERLGKVGMNVLLAAADSGDNRLRDRVAVAFAGFRTRPAADSLASLVANPHLLPGQRADLVRSYANYQFDPPLSLEPLATFLVGRPNETAVATAGLEVLAATRSLGGPKAAQFVMSLLDAKELDVRLAAIQAVEQAKMPAAVPGLLVAVTDATRPVVERTAALKAVRSAGGKQSAGYLTPLLAGTESSSFKAEVLRTLAVLDRAAARPAAEKLLDQPDPTLLGEAVAVLVTTPDGAKLAAQRYLAKKLPQDLWPRISEGLKAFASDPAIAALSAEVTRGGLTLSMQPREVERIRQLVLTKGDPKRGQELYLNSSALSCVTCHRVEGVGGQVGPDLTRVWDTHTVEKLMESMLQPSKEIKEGYQSYRVETDAGQVFTGLKVSETATEVVVREASGRDVRIAKADVERMAASKVSLMPDDAVSRISFDQFVDLLAFLKSRTAQEALRGQVFEYAVSLGHDPDLTRPAPPEAITAGGPPTADWQVRQVDATGLLLLKPLLRSPLTGAYALTYVYSPKTQPVTAVILSDDPTRVWVGKGVAFDRAVVKHQPFAAEEKFTAVLQPGWTPVLVKVVTTGPSHRIGLRLTGEGVRTAVKPDGK